MKSLALVGVVTTMKRQLSLDLVQSGSGYNDAKYANDMVDTSSERRENYG